MRRSQGSSGRFGRLLSAVVVCVFIHYGGASLNHSHGIARSASGSAALCGALWIAGNDPSGCLACVAGHHQVEVSVAAAILHHGIDPCDVAPSESEAVHPPPRHALHSSRAPPLA